MEWKSSTDKEKYGDMIGEVIHHTLFEDGTITKYDVKFGNRTIKNIPTAMLEVVKMQEHKHEADEDPTDDDDVEEGKIGKALGKAHDKVVGPALDAAGLAPGVGAVPDLANAAIYAARGKKADAAMSGIAAIPGAGQVATGAKWAGKGLKAGAKALKKGLSKKASKLK